MGNDLSANVMIDPSLLVAQKTLHPTLKLVEELSVNSSLVFYVPTSFGRILFTDESTDYETVQQFFLQNAYPVDYEKLRIAIKTSPIKSELEIPGELFDKHSSTIKTIYEQMDWEEYPRGLIGKILIEEWVFLSEYSWLVSRIRKPFRRFVRAGAVSLEFGEVAFDNLVKRSLKKGNDDLITRADKLRAFGKWIAVSGCGLSLFNPIIGRLSGMAGGFFLLFDPEKHGVTH